MAETVFYRFVVKRDTAAAFAAANTLLLQGEWALELDTGQLKMGDGVTPWNALAYVTTANIPEHASRLYFTDERAQDALAALLAAGTHTGIAFDYDDAGNKLSATVTVSGGGSTATPFTATEAMPANTFVAIVSGGVAKADATSGKPAWGYVTAAVASGATAQVFRAGAMVAAGLTAGTTYYLRTAGTFGAVMSAVSEIRQPVGTATSATELAVNIGQPMTRQA